MSADYPLTTYGQGDDSYSQWGDIGAQISNVAQGYDCVDGPGRVAVGRFTGTSYDGVRLDISGCEAWTVASVGLTPADARKLAVALLRAADQEEASR